MSLKVMALSGLQKIKEEKGQWKLDPLRLFGYKFSVLTTLELN